MVLSNLIQYTFFYTLISAYYVSLPHKQQKLQTSVKIANPYQVSQVLELLMLSEAVLETKTQSLKLV